MLPEPRKSGGLPLMEALSKRKSTRELSDYEIPVQVLSDLLWAAYGFNRPQEKKRTVPSAYNIQNMKIYVATADGLYLYDAVSNGLNLILAEDIRAETGTQDYVRDASVNLVYVADMSMMTSTGDRGEFYSTAHAGFIGQNVYLFCASFDLGTTVRDLIDRDALEIKMQLEDDEEIILAQSVGYPEGYIPSEIEGTVYSEKYSLSQNFPNPFVSETQINYQLSENAHVRINIYDLKGVKIKTILDKNQKPGEYNTRWNGFNDQGERMTSGIYFYKIDINSDNNQFTQSRKMMMLK
jgi:nitroreductase